MGDGGDLGLRHIGRETGDPVVARMNLHQRRGRRPDGARVVGLVCAVGGSDLDQADVGAAHHVRNAEGPADLDHLAARQDHVLLVRQGRQDEQHGGGVVVDHGGGLGAAQLGQDALDQAVALTSPAAFQVEFEVARLAHRHAGVFDGGFRKQRPP